MQSLMTWWWSSWVFCAPEVLPISGKVKVKTDQPQWSADYKFKCPKWIQLMITDTSYFLLFTVFQEFVRYTNKDIEQIIKKEMSGDVKNAFHAIGNNCLWFDFYCNILFLSASKCILLTSILCLLLSPFLISLCFAVCSVKNQPSYFADRLYKAMKVFIHRAIHMLMLSSCRPAGRHQGLVCQLKQVIRSYLLLHVMYLGFVSLTVYFLGMTAAKCSQIGAATATKSE